MTERARHTTFSTRLLAISLLSLPVITHAQDRVIGLVEIPQLYPQEISWSIRLPAGTVVLRESPSSSAPLVLDVRTRRQLASAEHDYEAASAQVYERRFADNDGLWYKLKYQDGEKSGFAWMRAGNDNQYHSLVDLLSDNLSYMTDDWDGRLRDEPSLDSAARTVPKRWDGSHAGAKLISAWGPREELWYLVAVMRGGACSDEPPEIIATGWVPASTPTGESPIWYYSRGC